MSCVQYHSCNSCRKMKSFVVLVYFVYLGVVQGNAGLGGFETAGEGYEHIEPSQTDWSLWDEDEYFFRKATPFYSEGGIGVCISTLTTATTISEANCVMDWGKMGWNANTCWATTTETIVNGGWGTLSPSTVTSTRTKTTITGSTLSQLTYILTATSTTALTSTTVETVSTATSTQISTTVVTNPQSTVVSTITTDTTTTIPATIITKECSKVIESTSYTIPIVLESTETCVTSTVTTTQTPSTTLIYLVTSSLPVAFTYTTCTSTYISLLNNGNRVTAYVFGSPVTSIIDTTYITVSASASTEYVDNLIPVTSTGGTTVPSSTCTIYLPKVCPKDDAGGACQPSTCSLITTTIIGTRTVTVITSTVELFTVTSSYNYPVFSSSVLTNIDFLTTSTDTVASFFITTGVNPIAATPTFSDTTFIFSYPTSNSIGTLTEFPACPQCTVTVTATEMGAVSTGYVFGTTTIGVTPTLQSYETSFLYKVFSTTTSTITPTFYTTKTVTSTLCFQNLALVVTTTTTYDYTVTSLATASTIAKQVTSTLTGTKYEPYYTVVYQNNPSLNIPCASLTESVSVITPTVIEVSQNTYFVNPNVVTVRSTSIHISGTVNDGCTFLE